LPRVFIIVTCGFEKKKKKIGFDPQIIEVVEIALLAQSVEHATFNRGVGGSSPPQGLLFFFRAC
jgi:hypothetical protein